MAIPHLLLPLLLMTYLTNFSHAEMCGEKTYTKGSLYEANLQYVQSTLRINALQNEDRFYTETFGEPPNKIYGLAMCYAFANQSDCSTCLSNTHFCGHNGSDDSANLKTVGSFEFSCLLRYSDRNFLSTLDYLQVGLGDAGPNVTDMTKFSNLLDGLVSTLVVQASSSKRMFAAGYVNSTEPKKLYGMAQCSKDTSAKNCSQCLDGCRNFIRQLSAKTQGGMYCGLNCYIRFKPYLFFPTELLTLPPDSSSPPNYQESKIHLGIILSLLALLVPLYYSG